LLYFPSVCAGTATRDKDDIKQLAAANAEVDRLKLDYKTRKKPTLKIME